jgi:hypothetical protein
VKNYITKIDQGVPSLLPITRKERNDYRKKTWYSDFATGLSRVRPGAVAFDPRLPSGVVVRT